MKVKTYRAPTIKAALEQIKRELGPDAFILSQKEVRPRRIFGVVPRSYVEVTAAVDYSETKSAPARSIDTIHDKVELSAGALAPPPAAKAFSLPAAPPAAPVHTEVLLDEIRKLRSMVQSISSDRLRTTIWLKPRQFSSPTAEQAYAELLARGIEEEIALNLVSIPGVSEQIEDFRNAIALELSRRIHIHDNIAVRTTADGPQIVALLGPTGVGKTTTLAKIAARAVVQDGLKVGMVTLDTFRIAAIAQLKTYAEIIGVPVRVVDNVQQMKLAIQKFSDLDLVLIDTTGRSQHEVSKEYELVEFMSQSREIKKALVLSATTKQSDLTDIVDRFEIFGTSCLIFTKLDETELYGPIINELVRSGKPLAYVTVGQTVPQDILRPDDKQIVELAVGPNHRQCWEVFVDLARRTEFDAATPARPPKSSAELQVTCQ